MQERFQCGADGPGLKRASTGKVGGISVKDFTDGAQSGFSQMVFQSVEQRPGGVNISGMPEGGHGKMPEKPGPNRSLMIRVVPGRRRTRVRSLVEGVGRGQGS